VSFVKIHCLVILLVLAVTLAPATAQNPGPITIEETIKLSGTVAAISGETLTLKDASGKVWKVLVPAEGQDVVRLSGGQRLRFESRVQVSGEYLVSDLKPGQIVRLNGKVNRSGKTSGLVREIEVLSGGQASPGIKVLLAAEDASDFSTCEIVCQFTRTVNGRLLVRIPAGNDFTRKSTLSFAISEDLLVKFSSADISRARAGARVSLLIAVRLNTNDLVAREIEVKIDSQTSRAETLDERLQSKYSHLSDEKRKPRIVRSPHYTFMTDVSDRQARIMLHKLENMSNLLTKYFGAGPRSPVEGFIVSDLDSWPEGLLTEPAGIAKIQEGAGICFSSSLGNQRRAILYACDDLGVIQHECTHGFCSLTFGSTGPTWLAEGVAELGQYWKLGQTAVDVNPRVIAYIQRSNPRKTLLEIAVPGRVPAGDWRDYAWRWALCQLLANNPNYSSRFKPLAISLMQKTEGVSFASVYGPVAPQISFEYKLFLENIDNGYRADLCAWQWNKKFKLLKPQQRAQSKVTSAYSWQASGVALEKGVSYDVVTEGSWAIEEDGSTYDADGDAAGRGQLVGILFNQYQLSVVIPLGSSATFTAPSDGQLFLRCQDELNSLGDNKGEIAVHLRRTP
jgi:hypothetical protein